MDFNPYMEACAKSLCESEKKPQISPLRYAPVEICGFFSQGPSRLIFRTPGWPDIIEDRRQNGFDLGQKSLIC
jgi:hypothetical protein